MLSIDCLSPISTYILSKTQISLSMLTGIAKHSFTMYEQIAIVFNAIVFPPAFGPEIIIKVLSLPRIKSLGTQIFLSINGCLVLNNLKVFSLFNFGIFASISFAYFTLADKKSNSPKTSLLFIRLFPSSTTLFVKANNILFTSSLSFIFSTANSFSNSKISFGSMKVVKPLSETSCTIPSKLDLKLLFTGIA